jgi:F0F1-type ATP synthase alpha subunit
VIDLRRNGNVRVALASGCPAPNETAVVEDGGRPFSVVAGRGYFGRVVDALGQPIDGRGEIARNPSLDRRRTVHMGAGAGGWGSSSPSPAEDGPSSSPPPLHPVPSIPARARPTATLPTGFKAVDAFMPLVRGQSTVVVGERGIGKTRFALDVLAHVARLNRAAADAAADADEADEDAAPAAPHTPFPVHLIYVAVGAATNALKDVVRVLDRSGALPYTAVVAAPSCARAGAQFAAPFTAAALAEHVRDAGGHALVVYDDLSAHHAAARRVSGVDWQRTGVAPAHHGALFERCASLAPSRGGGSLTALALLDSVPSGAAYVQLEHIKGRELVANTASLADSVLPLSTHALRAGALLPLDFADLVARTGHGAQGQALRHYANKARDVLVELRESARGAVTARAMGVESEADRDAVLDLHAKARVLLCPTRAALEGAAGGEPLDPDAVTRLGIDGLQFGKEEVVPGASWGGGGAGPAGGGPRDALSTVSPIAAQKPKAKGQQVRSFSSAAGGGGARGSSGRQTGAAGGDADDARQSASSSSAASSASSSASSAASSASSSASSASSPPQRPTTLSPADKYADLLSRMDPVQARTYLAVASRKQRKTGAALAAQAATSGHAYMPPPAAAAPARTWVAKAEEEGAGEEEARPEEAEGKDGERAARPNASARPAGTGYSWLYGNNRRTPAAPQTASPTEAAAPPKTPTGTRSYSTLVRPQWVSPGRVPARALSSTASAGRGGPVINEDSDDEASPPAPERHFRSPSGRAAPAQLFAGLVVTGDEATAASTATSSGSATASSTPSAESAGPAAAVAAGLPARLSLWEDAPHRGDPGRLLLSLFVVAHGYVQRVPFHRLFAYEAGLYGLLSAVPAPRLKGEVEAASALAERAPGDAPLAPLSVGVLRVPVSSTSAGFPTLLDAALSAPVSQRMESTPRTEVSLALREATRTFVQRSAALADVQRRAELAARRAREEAAEALAEEARASRSWFRFASPKLPPSGGIPRPETAAAEAAAAVSAAAALAAASPLQGLEGHLRTDPGLPLADLHPVWAAMHVTVAEYTRVFNGEPRA